MELQVVDHWLLVIIILKKLVILIILVLKEMKEIKLFQQVIVYGIVNIIYVEMKIVKIWNLILKRNVKMPYNLVLLMDKNV